ncbi:MAG: hypothetical protein FWE16_02060 [Firmicutes bacterium]|nr:hypothetical protein [Bacillota bacterium]
MSKLDKGSWIKIKVGVVLLACAVGMVGLIIGPDLFSRGHPEEPVRVGVTESIQVLHPYPTLRVGQSLANLIRIDCYQAISRVEVNRTGVINFSKSPTFTITAITMGYVTITIFALDLEYNEHRPRFIYVTVIE